MQPVGNKIGNTPGSRRVERLANTHDDISVADLKVAIHTNSAAAMTEKSHAVDRSIFKSVRVMGAERCLDLTQGELILEKRPRARGPYLRYRHIIKSQIDLLVESRRIKNPVRMLLVKPESERPLLSPAMTRCSNGIGRNAHLSLVARDVDAVELHRTNLKLSRLGCITCRLPCQTFVSHLAIRYASLELSAGCYSLTAVDFHHLLFA
jgi:hypothetical protein